MRYIPKYSRKRIKNRIISKTNILIREILEDMEKGRWDLSFNPRNKNEDERHFEPLTRHTFGIEPAQIDDVSHPIDVLGYLSTKLNC
jgi:hypothetical protein